MCGIIGKISRELLSEPLSKTDLDRIKHRGPDDQGLYDDDHASFGHLRLSIIDLSPGGHQPMLSPDDRYVIVYNGEVYNYVEIKERLLNEGVTFQSQSDTEVVLKSYLHWGPECLQHFRGMFAFSIWDKQNQTLFMARDRCGEKPFIYHLSDSHFYFSSEFKGLVPMMPQMPDLDPAVVDMYMHYQYAPEPWTLLKGVHKLPAAHYAILNVKDWSFKVTEYWNMLSIKADPSLTKADIKAELEKAVQLTLRSDVQVGIALSAGIDSAGIAAIASRHYREPMQAFCVGYPGRPAYDERSEAETIADFLGCKFNDVELASDQFIATFPDFALLLDEPIADIAGFGHYAVPKSCADKGVKVLLTGIGGDEVFWGYDWTRAAVSANQNRPKLQTLASLLSPFMKIKPFHTLLFKFSRGRKVPKPIREFSRQLLAWLEHNTPSDQLLFMAASGSPEFTKNYNVGKSWYGPAMASLQKNNAYIPTQMAPTSDIPTSILDLLFKTWLTGNCLSLGDRVSMAVGVETRLPLLDYKLIEKVVAWRKVHPDHTLGQKTVLRELLSDILPATTINRRKSGFVPPVMQWINGITKEYGDCLKQGHLVQQGILAENADIIELQKSEGLYPHTAYRLILLEQWYAGLKGLHA